MARRAAGWVAARRFDGPLRGRRDRVEHDDSPGPTRRLRAPRSDAGRRDRSAISRGAAIGELAAAASHPPRGGRPEDEPSPAAVGDSLGGTVHAVDLPADLPPGVPLSLQYVDLYGDVWLDVPELPDVEVLPPAEAESGDQPPCFEAATRYVQPGELICVCGRFPTPQAWSGLYLDDLPLGVPQSASSRTVWARVPATAAETDLEAQLVSSSRPAQR